MAGTFRLGMIGHGYIGRSLYKAFEGTAVEVVKVHDRQESNLEDLPPAVRTADPAGFLESLAGLDLVVEVAHPEVSASLGVQILGRTSYMPCSVVALADDDLRQRLLTTARAAGTRLYVPHGAVVGMDNLLEARASWSSVRITFRKPAASIDRGGAAQADEVLLFEGSAREIARKFPRSVNAMVACALATVGLDATTTRMYAADPRLGDVLRGEFEFTGSNGSRLTIIKEEPGKGVSGVGMVNSIRGSVLRALGEKSASPIFV